MNPCESFELQLPAYVAGEMNEADAAQLRAHLDGCASCREQAESLRLLHGAMAMSPLPEKLDAHRVAAISEKFRSVKKKAAKSNPVTAIFTRWFDDPARQTPRFSEFVLRFAFFVIIPTVLGVMIFGSAGVSSRRSDLAKAVSALEEQRNIESERRVNGAGAPQGSDHGRFDLAINSIDGDALTSSRTTPTSGKDGESASGKKEYADRRRGATHDGWQEAQKSAREGLAIDGSIAAESTPSESPIALGERDGRSDKPATRRPMEESKPSGHVTAGAATANGTWAMTGVNAPKAAPQAVYYDSAIKSGASGPTPKAEPPPPPPALAVTAPARPNVTYSSTAGRLAAVGQVNGRGESAGSGEKPSDSSYSYRGNNSYARQLESKSELSSVTSADPSAPAKIGGGEAIGHSTVAFNFETTDQRRLDANGDIAAGDESGAKVPLLGDVPVIGALAKNGSGTLNLSGVNTFSGGTFVNAGTLTLDSEVQVATAALPQPVVPAVSDLFGKVPDSPTVRASGADGLTAGLRGAEGREQFGAIAGNWSGGVGGGGGSGRVEQETELAKNLKSYNQDNKDSGLIVQDQIALTDTDGDANKLDVTDERLRDRASSLGREKTEEAGETAPAKKGKLLGMTSGGYANVAMVDNLTSLEAEYSEKLKHDEYNKEAMHGLREIAEQRYNKAAIARKADSAASTEEVRESWTAAVVNSDEKRSKQVTKERAQTEVASVGSLGYLAPDATAPGAGAKANSDATKLKTDYPKPVFVGTPVPVTVANLEPTAGSSGGMNSRFYSVPKSTMEKFKEGESYDKLAGYLTEKGIKTPAGSKASYDPETEKLVVTSTPQGLSTFDDAFANLEEYKEAPVDTAEPVRAAPPRAPAGFNPYIESGADAFSTFSIDVDTASYTLTRRALDEGRLPDPEQVRTEEIVNAFDYDYAPPANGAFAMHAALAPSPFRAPLELLKVGIQGSVPGRNAKKAAVLTLVIDTSGSMDTPDRLGRIRAALKMLAGKLQPQDSIAIVAFNTEARMLLDRTAGADKARIIAAIDSLAASGSTQLEGGMRLAYEVAARGFVSGAANRVILMSDGVANLGAATAQEILTSVDQYRKQGIYLTVLGFGSGNYDDAMLMQLADKGDGMYAFVDSDEEAKRLLVDQWEQTLHVIAKDVKIQIEFNPERVKRWRQIGYEKRQLKKQDFRNDAVDAGEVGSGQAVTALYDIELKEFAGIISGYIRIPHIATMRVRYKDPDTGKVTELEQRIDDGNRTTDFAKTPARFRIAACASEFAELLRVSPYSAGSDFAAVIEQLRPAANELPLDQRVQELVRLAERARNLTK